MPTITYYELSNYNAGILIPKTFDLDNVSPEEHSLDIEEWLSELTDQHREESNDQHPACPYEEWIVCDYEDMPTDMVGEYAIKPEYWELARIIEESELDEGIVRAYLEIHEMPDNGEEIRDRYRGQYRSDAEFAEELAIECGMMPDESSWPLAYIDWERAARDLMIEHGEHNGHYFSDQ